MSQLAALLILFVLACILFSSCMTLKKAETKVLSDTTGVNVVGKVWERTHPCIAATPLLIHDTIGKIIPGKAIEIKIPCPETKSNIGGVNVDTGGIFKIDDSNSIIYKPDADGKSIDAFIDDNHKVYTDTLKTEDLRRLYLSRDSIRMYQDSTNFYHNTLSTLQVQKAEVSSTWDWFTAALWHKLKWWVIGLLSVSLIYGVYKVYTNFWPKINVKL